MRKLEKLGISPAPWEARFDFWIEDSNGNFVFTDSCVADAAKKAHANAPMLAAAPELYEALLELYESTCQHCDLRDACHEGEDGMAASCNMMLKAKAALRKASGESEVRK